jgi:hypothetical protein
MFLFRYIRVLLLISGVVAFYAPDHKMSGALCRVLCAVSVNIWFPSIIGQTPGSIDPIFLWLIGGDKRKVPFDDQLSRSFLDFVSVNYLTNALVDWSDLFVAYWG